MPWAILGPVSLCDPSLPAWGGSYPKLSGGPLRAPPGPTRNQALHFRGLPCTPLLTRCSEQLMTSWPDHAHTPATGSPSQGNYQLPHLRTTGAEDGGAYASSCSGVPETVPAEGHTAQLPSSWRGVHLPSSDPYTCTRSTAGRQQVTNALCHQRTEAGPVMGLSVVNLHRALLGRPPLSPPHTHIPPASWGEGGLALLPRPGTHRGLLREPSSSQVTPEHC